MSFRAFAAAHAWIVPVAIGAAAACSSSRSSEGAPQSVAGQAGTGAAGEGNGGTAPSAGTSSSGGTTSNGGSGTGGSGMAASATSAGGSDTDGGAGNDAGCDDGMTYVPFLSDLQGYQNWTSYDISDEPELDADAGTGTPMHVYINKLPPHGACAFPTGTIIIKTIETGSSPADWLILGMVKRGGGYNLFGAVGWEWFDMSQDASYTLSLNWRGITPPANAGYGTVMGGVCNDCHAMAVANDYVQDMPLQLKNF